MSYHHCNAHMPYTWYLWIGWQLFLSLIDIWKYHKCIVCLLPYPLYIIYRTLKGQQELMLLENEFMIRCGTQKQFNPFQNHILIEVYSMISAAVIFNRATFHNARFKSTFMDRIQKYHLHKKVTFFFLYTIRTSYLLCGN